MEPVEVRLQGRKKVIVENVGHQPVQRVTDRTGKSYYVPNGLRVKSFSNGTFWLGETRVGPGGQVEYNFHLPGGEARDRDWRPSPTSAFRAANQFAQNQKYKEGQSGSIVIGVSFDSMQDLICERLGLEPLHREQQLAAAPLEVAILDDDIDLMLADDLPAVRPVSDQEAAAAAPRLEQGDQWGAREAGSSPKRQRQDSLASYEEAYRHCGGERGFHVLDIESLDDLFDFDLAN